jgi:hypothetical protein
MRGTEVKVALTALIDSPSALLRSGLRLLRGSLRAIGLRLVLAFRHDVLVLAGAVDLARFRRVMCNSARVVA